MREIEYKAHGNLLIPISVRLAEEKSELAD